MNHDAPSRAAVLDLCQLALKELGSDLAAGTLRAQQAYRMAKGLRDPVALAEALRTRGHADHRSARYRRAAQHYSRAVRLLDALHDEVGAARTRSSALQSLMYAGRLDEALAWADQARQTFARTGEALRLARLETNVGTLLYRQDRHAEALEAYRRALPGLAQAGDDESVAITLRNMAVAFLSLLEFEEALRCFAESRETFWRLNLPILASEIDDNIAYLHFLEGDYREAIKLYQATRSRDGQNPHKAAISLLDQSDLYLELNLFQEAVHLATQAIDRFQHLGLRPEVARSLQNLGLAQLHLGNVKASLAALSRARRVLAREKNSLWSALTGLSRALAMSSSGRATAALKLARAARADLLGSSMAAKSVLATVITARLELRSGHTAAARGLAAEARARVGDGNAPHLLLSADLLAGEAALAEGDRAAAHRAFLSAHELAEGLRQRLARDELQLSFLEDKRVIYESLAALHLEAGETGAAFQYVEQAKSRSLAEALVRPPARRPAGLPGEEEEAVERPRRRLQRLHRQLDQLEAQPRAATSPLLEEFRRQAALCERELAAALAGRTAEPSAHHPPPATATLAAVQERLAAGAAFLQYFQLQDRWLLLAVRADGARCFELGRPADVARESRLLRFQLSRGAPGWGHAPDDPHWQTATNRHLESLYELLVAPAAGWLPEGQWVVAPHRDLHRIPFHALRHGGRHIIDGRTVSYAPSAGVWLQCGARPRPEPGAGSLVLAVPDELSPLIASEATAVARLLPRAELYVGNAATLDKLRAPAARQAIHIASHGVFRADNPAFSAIRLADTRVSLLDLRDLPLQSELVTLSGCATGVHESAGADEIVGLARGVLLAGARVAQLSLWPVNDESTAQYMTAFYESWAGGVGAADALRTAMLKQKEVWRHPFFWAPFTLTGGA
ncbi:MAG: CHAT domain-containing protein [Bryobacterales bacterium]|nr:CHAT domain-containing protein [Bryobacterales bacterium]